MTQQFSRPTVAEDASLSEPARSVIEDAAFWKEQAQAAERRAQFAELRLRAMEARVNALVGYVARKPRHPNLLRLRVLPHLIASELKAAFGKIVRKIHRRRQK